jgi:6-pyruvoyltetrahydropterin/6-carboxytetrahydropterin synthase
MNEERFGIRVDKQYFNFCAAHFLIFEDGTREELHGHNYHVSVDIEGKLDGGNLVLDFISFKPLVKSICDGLDHTTILPEFNESLTIKRESGVVWVDFDSDRFAFPERDVRILPVPNTSTECLARYIAQLIVTRIREDFSETHVTRMKVSVSESPGQAGWYMCDL